MKTIRDLICDPIVVVIGVVLICVCSRPRDVEAAFERELVSRHHIPVTHYLAPMDDGAPYDQYGNKF